MINFDVRHSDAIPGRPIALVFSPNAQNSIIHLLTKEEAGKIATAIADLIRELKEAHK